MAFAPVGHWSLTRVARPRVGGHGIGDLAHLCLDDLEQLLGIEQSQRYRQPPQSCCAAVQLFVNRCQPAGDDELMQGIECGTEEGPQNKTAGVVERQRAVAGPVTCGSLVAQATPATAGSGRGTEALPVADLPLTDSPPCWSPSPAPVILVVENAPEIRCANPVLNTIVASNRCDHGT